MKVNVYQSAPGSFAATTSTAADHDGDKPGDQTAYGATEGEALIQLGKKLTGANVLTLTEGEGGRWRAHLDEDWTDMEGFGDSAPEALHNLADELRDAILEARETAVAHGLKVPS
jgi:hypothetical protein